MAMAIKTNSSHLRRAVNEAQPHKLVPGLFENYIIQCSEYESLEEFRKGQATKSEIVERISSTIENFLENNPSQLSFLIKLARRFGMLHGVSLMIKSQYGKTAICTFLDS